MTSIDRTAYPNLGKTISDDELSACYELQATEHTFIDQNARNDRGYLVLATMLKTRQQLGYFISLDLVPEKTSYSDEGEHRIIQCIRQAALTMSDPADLINVAIEELSAATIELPAFSTLDRIASRERHHVHKKLYAQITGNINTEQKQVLNSLLEVQEGKRITEFARMKQTPDSATLKHFRSWADRLIELDKIMNTNPFFEDCGN